MTAVHPYADRFPMLPADELQALADDIATSGQLRPITIWIDQETGEELLLDGRNRLTACEMVGVEPKAETYIGDPYAFIRSANNRRRNMTPGQQAAADALALFDQGLRLPGRWKRGAITDTGNSQRMTECGVILDEDPGLLQQVLAGGTTLPKAYGEVNEKRATRAKEGKQRSTLADTAPDLAAFVASGKLVLDEAWAAYEKRTQEETQRRAEIEKGIRTSNFSVAECVYKLAGYDLDGGVDRFLNETYPRHAEFVEPGMRLTPTRVAAAARFLDRLAEGLDA
jgi:hypothetical protein